MRVARVLIVFGRGVRRDGDTDDSGGYTLTPSSVARVQAAGAYLHSHRAAFEGAAARVIFSGGWSEVADGSPAPPEGCREGDLMLRLARAGGLDSHAALHAECRSRSTLENLLCTLEEGLLDGETFDAARPLGIVSHPGHTPRIRYLVRKVFGLRGPSVLDIPAQGLDVPAGRLPDPVLHVAARLLLAGARSHQALLRREERMAAVVRRLERYLRR